MKMELTAKNRLMIGYTAEVFNKFLGFYDKLDTRKGKIGKFMNSAIGKYLTQMGFAGIQYFAAKDVDKDVSVKNSDNLKLAKNTIDGKVKDKLFYGNLEALAYKFQFPIRSSRNKEPSTLDRMADLITGGVGTLEKAYKLTKFNSDLSQGKYSNYNDSYINQIRLKSFGSLFGKLGSIFLKFRKGEKIGNKISKLLGYGFSIFDISTFIYQFCTLSKTT
jgi:hypothetical protein